MMILNTCKFSEDKDAKVGHKTADSSFFGYKTHIAMSEERIITAAIITTGDKNDGKELQTLISKEAGINVKTIIGDAAYSGKENITYSNENSSDLVAKLSPVTQGTRTKEDEFSDYVLTDIYDKITPLNSRPLKNL